MTLRFRILLFLASLSLVSCTAADVKIVPATLGKAASIDAFLRTANQDGPILFEKHHVANWSVPLSGLLDLEHPKAISGNLEDRDEKIKLFVYTLKHPNFGTFIVDSGVAESFKDANSNSDISFVVKKAMNISNLKLLQSTKDLISHYGEIQGVFLTHVHLDHIMGMSDIGGEVPVYVGFGETSLVSWQHLATRGSTNRLLGHVGSLQEWQFSDDGIIDVLGDGSLWAISSPGHTPGSTAFLVRSTIGPQLLVGDVSHTRWGWDNGVGPGSYSHDRVQGQASLEALIKLTEDNSNIIVHPGHQD